MPWIADFERGFPDVKEELLSLRGRGGFQVLVKKYDYITFLITVPWECGTFARCSNVL